MRDKTRAAARGAAWYQANKERTQAKVLARRDAITRAIYEYLSGHPCIDCGETDPVVLEFDHRDPEAKEFSIGRARANTTPLPKLKEEIAKCDVRCANCHRRRTAQQFNHYKFQVGSSSVGRAAAC